MVKEMSALNIFKLMKHKESKNKMTAGIESVVNQVSSIARISPSISTAIYTSKEASIFSWFTYRPPNSHPDDKFSATAS